MAPLPPHWTINMACPHLGIGLVPFYISAFLGVMGVTVIHTTIGGGLEQMTSSNDFHIISWRNFFGLGAVICVICTTIYLRWRWRKELDGIDDTEPTQPVMREMESLSSPMFPSRGRSFDSHGYPRIPEILVQDLDNDEPIGSLGLIGIRRVGEDGSVWGQEIRPGGW